MSVHSSRCSRSFDIEAVKQSFKRGSSILEGLRGLLFFILDIPTLYIDPSRGQSFAIEFDFVPEYVTFITAGFEGPTVEREVTVSWARLYSEPFPLLIPGSEHLIFITVYVRIPRDQSESSSPLSSARDSS